MTFALVPPAVLATPVFATSADAKMCAHAIIQRVRPPKGYPQGFDTGLGARPGLLGVVRWRLPVINEVLECGSYSTTIEREVAGDNLITTRQLCDYADLRLSSAERRLLTAGLSFDMRHTSGASRRPNSFDREITITIRHDPTRAPGRYHLMAFLQNPYRKASDNAGMRDVLARFGNAARVGLSIHSPSFFDRAAAPYQTPVGFGADQWYQVQFDATPTGERRPVELRLGGLTSLEDAWAALMRTLDSFELHNAQSLFQFECQPDEYHATREAYDSMASGWGLSFVTRLLPSLEPFAELSSLPPGSPQWIPIFQWERGPWKNIVMSVLRCPDGLRLEFSSNSADLPWLRKEVAKAAPDLEFIPVSAPGTPGALYDF